MELMNLRWKWILLFVRMCWILLAVELIVDRTLAVCLKSCVLVGASVIRGDVLSNSGMLRLDLSECRRLASVGLARCMWLVVWVTLCLLVMVMNECSSCKLMIFSLV